MSLSLGERLGPYEIITRVGAGGMGEVYKARDTRLDRYIAIKVLPAVTLADPIRKLRFMQEAKAASALNHPGIVTIYDIGSENDLHYIAMELVGGKTLQEITPPEGLNISEALRYAVQASDALAKAHAAGIIHRDLKPNNLMVTDDGHLKILDFGLAKLAHTSFEGNAGWDTAAADAATRTLGSFTLEGSIVGTAPYMSPEQAEGRMVEAQSDIFSLGAVLYEMITGRQAFRGETQLSTLLAVMRDDPPPPSEIRAGTPPELERIIMRCLKKDPARRFQSAADLKVALQELQEEIQSGTLLSAAPAPPFVRPSWQGIAGWLMLAALPLCALGGWFLGKRSAEVDVVQQPVPLTSFSGTEAQASFSPDGNQVAFVWNGDKQDNFDIYVKLVGAGAPLRLTTDPGMDFSPKWSPDGGMIAFVRRTAEGRAVMLIPALGGPERKLFTFRRNYSTAPTNMLGWSPDGKWLAVSGSDEGPVRINLISVETGESRVLTHPPVTTVGDVDPAFAPDGRSLAFSRSPGLNVQELWVLPLTATLEPAGAPRKLGTGNAYSSGPVWTRSGREILFAGGVDLLSSIYRIPASGSGPARRIDALGDGVTEPSIARNGRRLAITRSFRNSLIWRLDTTKGTVEQFITSTFREAFPQYSPDGSRIVFYSNRTGINQIWVCNADGSGVAQLTYLKGTTTGTPRWSPDGQWISFDSNATGQWQIYTISAGGGKPRQLTNDEFTNVVASWSSDGRFIYFNSKRSGIEEVWKMPSEGGEAVQVTHGGGSAGMESSDGKTLYYTLTKAGRASLWKMPVSGGEATEIVKSIHRYNYAPSNKGVFYNTPNIPGSPSTVEFLDFASGKVRTLYTLPKPIDHGLAVSPDQRYVLFAQRDFTGSDLLLVDNFQ